MSVVPMKNLATYRLPSEDINDLSFYFLEFESSVGLRSMHAAMVEVLSTGTQEYVASDWTMMHVKGTSHSSHWQDPYTEGMLRSIGRSRKIRENLLQMIENGDSLYVNVLFSMYGPPRLYLPYSIFGELAPIVDWSDEAQALGDKEAVEKAIRGPDGERVRVALRASADRMLSDASRAYMKAQV